jgi:hypothetical protein
LPAGNADEGQSQSHNKPKIVSALVTGFCYWAKMLEIKQEINAGRIN